MGITYAEKLQDPRWAKRRAWIIKLADYHCQDCREESASFQVHHKIYTPNTDPWDYPDEALIAVCRRCHERRDRIALLARIAFQTTNPERTEQFLIALLNSPGLLSEQIERMMQGLGGAGVVS